MFGRVDGGCWNLRFRLSSVNTISSDLPQLRVELFVWYLSFLCQIMIFGSDFNA